MQRSYMTGHWAVYKSRGPGSPIGYFIDGEGVATAKQPPFRIAENVLYDPDGKRLGYLAPLGESWAVNLSQTEVGHILRRQPD